MSPDVPPLVPYYESADLRTPLLDSRLGRSTLTRALRRAGLTLEFERPDGLREPIRSTSSRLSDATVSMALGPLWSVLSDGTRPYAGAEFDMVAERTAQWLLLVSVRWDDGRYVVSEFRHPRGLQEPGPDEDTLRRRWGVGPLVAVDRPFDAYARGLVDDALGALTEGERALLAGMPFHRRSMGSVVSSDPRKIPSAAFVGGDRIELYDTAFEPSARFVGEPWEARSQPVAVVLHELGHAFAGAPLRRAREHLAELELRFHQDAEMRERVSDDRRPALDERMTARKAAAAAIDGWLADTRRIEAAWVAAVGDESAPTRYGRTTPVEGFAEVFSLAHADPRALERAAPRSAAWIAAGGHLEAVRQVIAELDALAAPGLVL